MKFISPRTITILIISLIIIGVMVLALAGYLSSIVGAATQPFIAIQRWISTRVIAFSDFLTMPRDVTSLRQQNTELQSQVSQLESQVIELKQQLSQAEVLYALLDFARARPENQYIASTIIGRDPSPFLHYIFIDHGSDDGLRHGMPVVTNQGLVGTIDAVTANAARVLMINDPGAVVNIYLQSTQVQAQLSGSLTSEISLDMVPQDVEIPSGELVLTSGLGGDYPQDIIVGQVTSVRKRENDLFQTAVVSPVVDFSKLSAVLVIINFTPVDITPLLPEQ
jgi:rod shape-determining protein MreC